MLSNYFVKVFGHCSLLGFKLLALPFRWDASKSKFTMQGKRIYVVKLFNILARFYLAFYVYQFVWTTTCLQDNIFLVIFFLVFSMVIVCGYNFEIKSSNIVVFMNQLIKMNSQYLGKYIIIDGSRWTYDGKLIAYDG